MKLLDNPHLLLISSLLSECKKLCRLNVRVESYSCKMAGQDKKLYKHLLGKPGDLEALAPFPVDNHVSRSYSEDFAPSSYNGNSLDESEGVLCASISLRTLHYLKATLTEAFSPDYDFSSTKSSEFSREPSCDFVTRIINSQLFSVLGEDYTPLSQQLWTSLSNEIQPEDCDIYSYNPDLESDPFGEDGILWSFNYFFYNKKMKRLVFFMCRAISYSVFDEDDDDGRIYSTPDKAFLCQEEDMDMEDD